ncbi:MAG: lipase family alpha/beta hydrolase [Actinomycetes bacterium]
MTYRQYGAETARVTRTAPASPRPRQRRHRLGVLGALALATDVVAADLVLGTASEAHQAIGRRVFGTLGAVTGTSARAPQRLHDGIVRTVYGGVGAGLRTTARTLRHADRRGVGPLLEDSPRGRFVVSAVNGLIGDKLAERHPEAAIELAVRRAGRDVPTRRDALAEAFPAATGDLVVFLHGLAESEHYWDRRGHETGGSYGDRLARERTWTPVYLRANTGLPIAENGAALAGLLDRLVEQWPVPVERIALVGHSMGGLIMRAACAVQLQSRTPWHDLVTDVVTLGTPHLGAPIERGLHLGTSLLGRLPEAAPFGRILEYRSVGILDLRAGLAADVQNLPHARYRLVAATLASSHRHPVSEVLGDLLVRYPSAVGHARRGRPMFPGADVLHVRGDHFDLLNHDEVYAALRRWLDEPVRSGSRSA